MRLVPGDPERLGSYWLAGRLGAGGQGVVYEAYDEQGARYAIKVLHGGVTERLAKEAQAAARVASFCTVNVVEVRLDAAPPYIVSEFVEGPNLRQAVERRGAYAGEELFSLAAGLATALAAVHEAGVVHRDLKPENVLLAPDGLKVIDFGVARTAEMSLTTTGFVAGTPTYMAPEVFTGQRAGPPADVFAWGGVVLYAATGRDPFQAESLGGVMHRVLTVDPDLDDLPEPLRALVARALSKDPAQRPQAQGLLLGDAPRLSQPAGLTGARPLGELAEEVYATLTPHQQKAVPGLLLRMVGEDAVRRIPLAEAENDEVLSRLTDAGLLVRHSIKVPPTDTADGTLVAVSDDSVAPASGALFHAWPRLREWLNDDGEGLPVHRRLREAALYWHSHRRRTGDLYQGTNLDAALGWAATGRRHLGLNPLESDFLHQSSRLARGRLRRRRFVMAGMAALLAVAVSASVLAVRQNSDLSGKLAEANARAVAARADSLRASDPQAAMRLSVVAWKLSPVFEARTALQRSLAQPELGVFTEPQADAEATYRLTGDGERLIKWQGDALSTWDVATGKKTAQRKLPQASESSLSSDGRILATAAGGVVHLWDVASGEQLPGEWAGEHPVLYAGGRLLSVDDGKLYAVDQDDPLLRTEGKEVTTDESGRWVALSSADGTFELWDTTRHAKLFAGRTDPPISTKGEAGAPLTAFSADGETLAVAGDVTITLIDTATGKRRPEALQDTSGGQPIFSPDGRFLAEVTDTGVELYRIADRHILGSYTTRRAEGDHAFTPDGRTIRYLTTSGSVVSLDIAKAVQAPSPTLPVYTSAAAVLSADGRVAATESGQAIQLFDAVRRRPIGKIKATGALALDGRGTVLAIAGNPVTVWDVTTREQLASLEVGDDPLAVTLSADGKSMAAARGRTLQLWDVRSRSMTTSFDGVGDSAMAFSPDGKLIAAGADLVDPATGKVTRDPARVKNRMPTAVAFAPGGTTLAYGLSTGQVVLWDLATSTQLGTFEVNTGKIGALRFSPDGRLLAVDGEQIRLWESSPLREVGQVPVGPYAAGLAFSADGKSLRGVLRDGSVQESPVDPALTVEAVCQRAGGTLNEQDWDRLVPETDFRADVCDR